MRGKQVYGVSILLIPGATASQVAAVPITETEQPGMGKAVGGVLGGAIGMAAGMELGAAAATILIPGGRSKAMARLKCHP